MTPDLRHRFYQLLLALPLWEREGTRHALIGTILRGYPIWERLNLSGSQAEAADRLLNLYPEHGPEPYLALLGGLTDETRANPEIQLEIEALSKILRAVRPPRPRQPWKDAPYRGLAYFDQKHAPIFFGRDAEVDALYTTITQTEQGRRFCVVVGASGSGKSSLVRAGLWPRLSETKQWFITAMTPLELGTPAASLRAAFVTACKDHDGFEDQRELAASLEAKPLAEITSQLLSKSENTRWLLILDQMEELFAPDIKTLGASFLDRLLEATRPASDGTPSRFQVLATLRADFSHYCLDHPPLQRAIYRPGGQFPLTAPARLALERMVSGPLTELDLPAKWTLDPALPPTIALDAERHPGGLALMAFTLRELYDVSTDTRRLDVETYRGPDFGGLSGAIARRADATLKALGEDSAKTLERVFARLVRVNRDDAPTRQRASLTAWDDDPEARKLLDAFQKARLLVCDTGAVVEVAHEALLREWPTLASWIENRRDAFALAERVRTEAHAWMIGPASRHHHRPWLTEQIEEYRARLASAGLLEQLCEDPHVARLLTPEREWILGELRLEATPHYRRAQIGTRLAEISDPRPGIGVIGGVPDILWRSIPPGQVEIEGRGQCSVHPFHIAAFPITVAQFRAFLDADDGYPKGKWWMDLKREDQNVKWSGLPANHPITRVSWFDATAFCRWLTSRFRFEVRLPGEHEWQWAAQSAQSHFEYPWGPEWRENRANTDESGIHATTAVGAYPHGESQQKVSDLAGNVWEWCTDAYSPSSDLEARDRRRVVRGGSWSYGAGSARAAFRGSGVPDSRSGRFGFRVVSSSPIADH
jgi:hypothetical protein